MGVFISKKKAVKIMVSFTCSKFRPVDLVFVEPILIFYTPCLEGIW